MHGYSNSAAALKKTGLYEYHRSHKAKMVSFGGYSMPLTYRDVGQVASEPQSCSTRSRTF
ncbi:hypothetical protein JB92DRAFT_1967486 [Gautieria morchelliformis]|nr:hypothetical protein JB92DRAFT_1967486 [Gautieria morchelliformis]